MARCWALALGVAPVVRIFAEPPVGGPGVRFGRVVRVPVVRVSVARVSVARASVARASVVWA